MRQLIDKPYLYFLLAIPLFLVIGLWHGDDVLDVGLYDTYYVASFWDLAILACILFGIMGLGYALMKEAGRKQLNRLIWIHVGFTFGGILLVWIMSGFYRADIMEYKFNNYLSAVISVLVLLILLVQFIFPINIVYGLTRAKSK